MAASLRTCKFCGGQDLLRLDGVPRLFKYSVRHYAHAACGLERMGEKFLDAIPGHELHVFPALVADRFGLFDALLRRVKAEEKKS